MGDGAIDDKDLVINVAGQQAGGDGGQLLLESITFTAERENTEISGVGNDVSQALKHGDRTYSISSENHLSGAAADLVRTLTEDPYESNTGYLRANNEDGGSLEARIGKIDWNNIEWSISDDGDVMLSIEANAREVEWE